MRPRRPFRKLQLLRLSFPLLRETPFAQLLSVSYNYYVGVCAPVRDGLCRAAHGDGAEDSASCQIVMNPDPGSDPSTYTFNNGVARNRTLLPIPGADGEGVRIVYNDGEYVSGATPVVRMHQANVASLAGQDLRGTRGATRAAPHGRRRVLHPGYRSARVEVRGGVAAMHVPLCARDGARVQAPLSCLAPQRQHAGRAPRFPPTGLRPGA